MRSLVGGTTAAAVLIGLLASACGGDDDGGPKKSPAEACKDGVVATCAKLYDCLTPVLLAAAMLPATESACVTQLTTGQGCEDKTPENACMGSEKYHADQAAKCTDQISQAECSQILASAGDLGSFAPACDSICVID